ncbi:hypothetical protein ACFL5G_05180 [Candidatus Margulisiibacteriota bacterium]
MTLNIFILFWGVLFSIFTRLAFLTKNMKVYLTGCLTSLFYFFAVSEGIIYVYHHKIPMIGALVNPFPGRYRPLLLNIDYHWEYLAFSLLASVIFFIRLNSVIKKSMVRPLQNIPVQRS